MVDLVDEPGVDDRIRGVRIGEHDEEADERGHEHQRSRREQERPGLAIGARQGLDVEAADSLPDLAAPAIHDAMASRHQSVEIEIEEHTSELQSQSKLVCSLLLETTYA